MIEKQHFVVLDWLRGLAAIVVVIFHLFESVYQSHDINLFKHGFLAVDFFFCLSGFVISYAYDNRIGKLSYLSFIKKRLIRLHPLVILGSFLGLIIYFLDPWGNYSRSWDFKLIGAPFIQSNLLIPTLAPVPNRYGNLFPFNPPSWSLCLEYVANIVYIFFLWKISRKALVIMLVFASLFLVYIANKYGTLSGGWHADTFTGGIARMIFSFLIGLAINRYHILINSKVSSIAISMLLLATFMIPFFNYNWVIELVVVMVFYPLIIALSARKNISSKLAPWAALLGRLSYPLYLTHYWFISSVSNFSKSYHPNGLEAVGIIVFSTVGLILFAYTIMRFYDEPVRKWLNEKT